MTWIKICGTTNLDDALLAVDAGADAVGFVFYEKSPRNLTVETAREIVAKLPENLETIGVFVDADSARIRETVISTGITAVQLHGIPALESVLNDPRPPLESIGVSKFLPVIPGNLVHEDGIIGLRMPHNSRAALFAVLIDNQVNGASGGTGVTFDWEASRDVVQTLSLMLPIIVAGGLTPNNVADAMKIFHPFGVDVVSGVEASPGKKSPDKVRAFVKAVRDIDRKTS